MAVFKCKMCGGTLEVKPGETTCECEYCGTVQTVPSLKDENLQSLFNRANALRMKAEFDKAADIYEKIVQADETEAEAYWGLVLCKYGIEYVEDPTTYKRIPTCHRTSFEAVVTDEDYLNAIKYADTYQKGIYEAEAQAIDEIQKGILAVVAKESAYDVFICYKEADENGKRTADSVIANDIYYQLTQEGFKVFYAAISLEDKIGSEYEPYIFAALNSAKVMLVLGTKPEYFNAVWVKNEWSRYLKIMKQDHSRTLIPCYRDMDAYDLPEEFAHLQAQDMSKIGFINDVIRGIKKILDFNKEVRTENVQAMQAQIPFQNASSLIKRGNMSLEDKEWKRAKEFFDQALNIDAENGEAYLGQAMVTLQVSDLKELQKHYYADNYLPAEETLSAGESDAEVEQDILEKYSVPYYLTEIELKSLLAFSFNYQSKLSGWKQLKMQKMSEWHDNKNLSRARKYASTEIKAQLDSAERAIAESYDEKIQIAEKEDADTKEKIIVQYTKHLEECREKALNMNRRALEHRETEYQAALKQFDAAQNREEAETAKKSFSKTGLIDYKDSKEYIRKCDEKIEGFNLAEKETKYQAALKQFDTARNQEEVETAKESFLKAELIDYKDSKEYIRKCDEKIEVFLNEEQQKAKKKRNKLFIVIGIIVVVAIIVILIVTVVLPNRKKSEEYQAAMTLYENQQYDDAIQAFEELENYKDSESMVSVIEEEKATYLLNEAYEEYNNQDYENAINILLNMEDSEDIDSLLEMCIEGITECALSGESIDVSILDTIPDDFYESNENLCYSYAQILFNNTEWQNAEKYFELCAGYEMSDTYIIYTRGRQEITNGQYEEASADFVTISDFLDSEKWLGEACYQQAISGTHDLDEVISLLSMSTENSDSAETLLELCDDLLQCEGQYKCYQKIKTDGTLTTNDCNNSLKLSFYLYEGNAYLNVTNSLFHDHTIYDGIVETSSSEYDFEAKCLTSKSRTKYDEYYFSAASAKYVGVAIHEGMTYFYSK